MRHEAGSPAVAFTIPGEPQGKGRARVGRVAGHARMFTPAKTVAYEGLVALAAQDALQLLADWPLQAPMRVAIEAAHAVPASWSKKKQAEALAGAPCVRKPDLDNVAKAVGDAGNGILWRDDTQVVQWTLSRVWAQAPGVSVVVEPVF